MRDRVNFNTADLPWCSRDFLKQVAIKYKGDSQMMVCLTCHQFDCSRPGHRFIECRHFIINAHILDVVTISKSFPSDKRSDLIEEALLVITDVITNHSEKLEPDMVTGFIRAITKNTMLDYLRRDKFVGPKTREKVFVLSYKDVEDRKSGNTVDLLDTVDKCCKDNKQRFIATCIMEGGWKVQEMADELNISLAYAGRLKSELESKIWSRWYINGDRNEEPAESVCCLSKCNGRRHIC